MSTAPSTYALELKDLRKSFGKTEIIRGTNLAVRTGERVAVIGPNGAGKSTLFNLISGRFAPRAGEWTLREDDIDAEIARLGDTLALALLPGVQYRTGQALDLARGEVFAVAHRFVQCSGKKRGAKPRRCWAGGRC